MKPKNTLIRIVKSPEGDISPDLTGKKPGRGAYICSDPECLKRAEKSKALSRAFKTQIPTEIMEELQSTVTPAP